jgi:GR25 family glycosyltransferase involved in LPS biosynthesis
LKAYVITLEGHPYSERKAARCIESGAAFGVTVERFPATGPEDAHRVMRELKLRWTWAGQNDRPSACPITGLQQRPYGSLAAKIGCSLSHYRLWQKCAADGPILILEHDAVFIRPLPDFDFAGICQINDPSGATPHGAWWSAQMAKRGPGVWPKTPIFPDNYPDGLAGNSAYVVKPHAAEGLIAAFHRLGIWPNDATTCRQLFELQELYPFVTRTEQEQSTTCPKPIPALAS